MITALLIVHGLLAVALLGDHPSGREHVVARAQTAGSFGNRFRSVTAASYTNAIVVLYIVTMSLARYLSRVPHLDPWRARRTRHAGCNGLFRAQGTFCRRRPRAAAGLLVFLAAPLARRARRARGRFSRRCLRSLSGGIFSSAMS